MRSPLVFAVVLTAISPFAAANVAFAQAEPAIAPVASPSLAPTTATAAFPADPATRAAMLAAFDTLMVEQRHVGEETRSAMLAALTPAHRSFVASLVGQLATAPTPDPAAAARQIDASLSPSERLGVLHADTDRRALERDLMGRIAADMMARMSPDERAAVRQRAAQAQSDATRLTPAQRAALLRDTKSYMGIFAPGLAALGTPQSAGELVLQALTTHANALGP